MDYFRLYSNIIEDARHRNSGDEKHHIFPKCWCKDELKYLVKDPRNLVSLTAREHFLSHWLLTKIFVSGKEKFQMLNAFGRMMNQENPYQKRDFRVTSRTYQTWRENWKNEHSKNHKGKVVYTQELREKMSKSAKNRKRFISLETRQKLRERMIGENNPNYGGISEEHRQNIINNRPDMKGKNNPNFGNKYSDDTKNKIRMFSLKSKHNKKENNLKFDSTIYIRHNVKTKENFRGTQHQFRENFGYSYGQVCTLCKGRVKMVDKQWILIGKNK